MCKTLFITSPSCLLEYKHIFSNNIICYTQCFFFCTWGNAFTHLLPPGQGIRAKRREYLLNSHGVRLSPIWSGSRNCVITHNARVTPFVRVKLTSTRLIVFILDYALENLFTQVHVIYNFTKNVRYTRCNMFTMLGDSDIMEILTSFSINNIRCKVLSMKCYQFNI